MNKLLFAGMAAGLALIASAAQASLLYSFAGPTGPMASPGSVNANFASGGGAGSVSFSLDGYTSLDGDNFYIDIFTLSLNGAAVAQGTFDMGGGGVNRVFFAPVGFSISPISFGGFAGGRTDFFIPLSLIAGVNSLTFSYESPLTFEGSGRAGPQGTGDEAWGLHDILVNGPARGDAVPEPAAWMLMIGGFGLAGVALRRRRAPAVA
jgi:hypothetical protein